MPSKPDSLGFRLKERCRGKVYDCLKGRTKKSPATEKLIGCTIEELKAHLEKQFIEGMSWDNYGKGGWDVDHKRPCVLFNMTDENQLKECFHYTNLQPLWRKDNASKGSLHNNKRYKYADHVNSK